MWVSYYMFSPPKWFYFFLPVTVPSRKYLHSTHRHGFSRFCPKWSWCLFALAKSVFMLFRFVACLGSWQRHIYRMIILLLYYHISLCAIVTGIGLGLESGQLPSPSVRAEFAAFDCAGKLFHFESKHCSGSADLEREREGDQMTAVRTYIRFVGDRRTPTPRATLALTQQPHRRMFLRSVCFHPWCNTKTRGGGRLWARVAFTKKNDPLWAWD